MPIRLMRQIFRERRRVALVVVLAFAALRLAGPAALAQPLPAAALSLGLGAALAVACGVVPRLRGPCGAAAVAGLAFAGLIRALPGSLRDIGGPAGDEPVAVAVWLGLVALAMGARRALGALTTPCLRNCRFKARAGSRVDIFRLWHGLVPTPAGAARTGDPDLRAIEDMSLRLGRVRLVSQTEPQPAPETGLQILDVEAPFHIRMRACAEDHDGATGAPGISEIFLIDLGPRRLVLFAHEFPAMPLGRALLAWLDDAPGRMLDRRLAIIERSARTEAARRAPGAHPGTISAWQDDNAREAGQDAGSARQSRVS